MAPPISRRRFLRQIGASVLTVAGAAGAGLAAALVAPGRAQAYLRPPGALPEPDFLAACIRCGRCADACPNRAIMLLSEATAAEVGLAVAPGHRGTPVIVPRRQACILCNGLPGDRLLCTEACPSGALEETAKAPDQLLGSVKMGTAEVDRNICYSYNGASCGACVRACPLEGKALRAGLWERPIVDAGACVGCGLCERSCVHYPQAIRVRPAREAV